MNNHSEMILDEYGQKYTIYFKVMEIVLDTLRGFVTEYGILVNTVEARVKDYLSLKEKLERNLRTHIKWQNPGLFFLPIHRHFGLWKG